MNEYTWLYIAVGIDVEVTLNARFSAVYKFAVVLEVDGKQLFAALNTKDFTNFMIHVLSLLRT